MRKIIGILFIALTAVAALFWFNWPMPVNAQGTTVNGDRTVVGVLQAGGFKSSDGTAGTTGNNFKNGLCTAASGGCGSGANITSGTYASLPGTCTHTSTQSDIYQATDVAYRFLCTATNTWSAYNGDEPVVVPPQSWTVLNSATNTINGNVFLSGQPHSGVNIAGLYNAAPSTPYSFIAKGTYQLPQVNYTACGGLFYESATGKLETLEFQANTTSGIFIQINRYTNTGSFSAHQVSLNAQWGASPYFKIGADGTNLYFAWCHDAAGNGCIPLYQEAKGAFFTTAPNDVGIACDEESNAATSYANMSLISWKQTAVAP